MDGTLEHYHEVKAMQHKEINKYRMTARCTASKRSLGTRIIHKCLDLLQQVLLLAAFLMFISYVQVATAAESGIETGMSDQSGLWTSEPNYALQADIVSPLNQNDVLGQSGTDMFLKLVTALLCICLAIWIRTIMFRYFHQLPSLDGSDERLAG